MNNNKLALIIKNFLILIFALLLAGLWGIKKPDILPIESQTNTGQVESVSPNYSLEFHLLIPALNISAPIIPDVSGTDKEAYFKALESGVAHFAGTAKPGENNNIFLFGHSSFYSWAAGDYKEVFLKLEEIKKDDKIIVWYKGKQYQYRVESTKVVDPTDVSVLSPTNEEQLTIMTCVPPGTADQRLIVIAKPN